MDHANKTVLQKFSKELSILHYAMTFGTLAVTILLYFFTVENGQFDFSKTDDFFLYLCPLLAIGGIFLGTYLFTNMLDKMDESANLQDKLMAYRTAKIRQFALLEGPALISAIAMMQTQNLIYLIIALALAFYLFSQRVTEDKIVEDLRLD